MLRLERSVPTDILSSQMFCPTDVMSPDVLSHERFVCRMFWSSGCFVLQDVLSLQKFLPAGRFVTLDICPSGRFAPVCYVSGRYVSGRYVSRRLDWAPQKVVIINVQILKKYNISWHCSLGLIAEFLFGPHKVSSHDGVPCCKTSGLSVIFLMID